MDKGPLEAGAVAATSASLAEVFVKKPGNMKNLAHTVVYVYPKDIVSE
jgi:hypothetical protein